MFILEYLIHIRGSPSGHLMMTKIFYSFPI